MGWVVAKAKTKKQDGTNGRVLSGYAIHMHPQGVSIPPQGLDRRVLTVGAVSGPHYQIRALHWHHFTSCRFTWLEKSTVEKHTS